MLNAVTRRAAWPAPRCGPGSAATTISCVADRADQDRRERPVPLRRRPIAMRWCFTPHTAARRCRRSTTIYSYRNNNAAAAVRADDVLHRPLAVPARTDDPVQRHLPGASISSEDNYKTIPGRDADGDLRRRQRQRDRTRRRTGPTTTVSFSGSVTAPRDRLMGRMTIRVDGEPNGATQVTVEEYKRPKFQVALDAPKEAAAAERRSQAARQGHGLHRRGHRRRQGPLASRPPGALSGLVVLALLVDAAATGCQPGDRPRHGDDRGQRHVRRRSSPPSPICRWPKRASRRSSTRSTPT